MTSRVDTSDWPLLTRFYGLTPKQLHKLPRGLLNVYRKAIPEILAQEMLVSMSVADFPNMQAEDRTRMHKDLLETTGAKVDEERQFEPGSNADVTALAALGIAIVQEDTDA